MSAVEFEAWPKIARLNRDIVVTEKIDGTNAAVLIKPIAEVDHIIRDASYTGPSIEFFDSDLRNIVAQVDDYLVFAQSRTRFITPGADNYGFAKWVAANAEALVATLGEGRHFGEWWGGGIQRSYGRAKGDRTFSLFNTSRWNIEDVIDRGIVGLSVVPVLYQGVFDTAQISTQLERLRTLGSVVAPGAEAEGVVVFHTAANSSFKVTLKGDEAPKGAAAHAKDESPL